MIKSHSDLIDKFGNTLIKIKEKSTSTILIIDLESWQEIPSCPVPSKEEPQHNLFLPVLHAYSHNLVCRSQFAPNFKLCFGLEDGENAERFCSQLPFASHTSFMRKFNRRNYITMHVHTLSR